MLPYPSYVCVNSIVAFLQVCILMVWIVHFITSQRCSIEFTSAAVDAIKVHWTHFNMNYHAIEVASKRWVICDHVLDAHGEPQYSGCSFQVLTDWLYPYHTNTAAWTVDSRQVGVVDSYRRCQILTSPSMCISRKRDSLRPCDFRSSAVQFWWVCAHQSQIFCFWLTWSSVVVHPPQVWTCCAFRVCSPQL